MPGQEDTRPAKDIQIGVNRMENKSVCTNYVVNTGLTYVYEIEGNEIVSERVIKSNGQAELGGWS
jgi:hypothetical protein